MKKLLSIIIVIHFCVLPVLGKWASTIPLGTSHYDLFINGSKVGNATFSNKLTNGHYLFQGTVYLSLQGISIRSEQVSLETTDFKPIKLESTNTIIKKDRSEHKTRIKALFKDNKVFLDTNGTKYVVPIQDTFFLEGNYFLKKMIDNHFRPGTVLSTKVYSPEYEIYKPITLYHKLVGIKEIAVNGKMMKVFHIIESVENIKSVDVYLNAKGVAQKIAMTMLNNKIEYILARHDEK